MTRRQEPPRRKEPLIRGRISQTGKTALGREGPWDVGGSLGDGVSRGRGVSAAIDFPEGQRHELQSDTFSLIY